MRSETLTQHSSEHTASIPTLKAAVILFLLIAAGFFVIPVSGELNLKKAAAAVHEKSIRMIPQKELFPLTGYVHGGCSPIGMKKAFPTVFDFTADLFDTVCFSAGKIGFQVECSFQDLLSRFPFSSEDLT